MEVVVLLSFFFSFTKIICVLNFFYLRRFQLPEEAASLFFLFVMKFMKGLHLTSGVYVPIV